MRTNLGTSPSDTWITTSASAQRFMDTSTIENLDNTMEMNSNSSHFGNSSVEGQELFFYKVKTMSFFIQCIHSFRGIAPHVCNGILHLIHNRFDFTKQFCAFKFNNT